MHLKEPPYNWRLLKMILFIVVNQSIILKMDYNNDHDSCSKLTYSHPLTIKKYATRCVSSVTDHYEIIS